MEDALVSALEKSMTDMLISPQAAGPSSSGSTSSKPSSSKAQKAAASKSSFPVPYKKGPVDYSSDEPPPLESAVHPIGPRPAHYDHPVFRARQAVPAMERIKDAAIEEFNTRKERKRDRKSTCGRCGKKVEKGAKTKLFKCSQCKCV
jgi:hypothetical protein